jgi:hypothetical protein
MSTLYDAQDRGFPDVFTVIDRAAEISTNAVKASVRKALTHGAQSARLLGAQVEELKVHTDDGEDATGRHRLAHTREVRRRSVGAFGTRAQQLRACHRHPAGALRHRALRRGGVHASLTAAVWEEMALTVAGRIEQWLAGALHRRSG